MNKSFSEEIIEIDGKEYKLFVNRIGIVNWEQKTGLQDKAKDIKEKYQKLDGEEANNVIEDDYDPFAEYSDLEADEAEMKEIYSKFYHMALYKHHKFTVSEANELFEKAIAEYGLNQLAELALQILDEVNAPSEQTKKLKALKSTK